MIRVLVCGGRDFTDKALLFSTLDRLFKDKNVTIIHGAARGADRLAGDWAAATKQSLIAYPADWKRYPRAAGAIRNKKMLEEGRPDLIVAFPGGRGTAHMIKIAQAAGVTVLEFNATA